MAPEVVKYNKYCRFSDIWSLGCTIIEMATGCPPWSKYTNPTSAMYHIGNPNESPEIPEFLSENAKDFLRKCLQYKPQKRGNVYELLRHSWLSEMFQDDNIKIKIANISRKPTTRNVF